MSAEHDAIAAAIEDVDPGSVVTKFVIVAEVIGPDGKRNRWTDTDDDATPWDSKGILLHALDEMCSDE